MLIQSPKPLQTPVAFEAVGGAADTAKRPILEGCAGFPQLSKPRNPQNCMILGFTSWKCRVGSIGFTARGPDVYSSKRDNQQVVLGLRWDCRVQQLECFGWELSPQAPSPSGRHTQHFDTLKTLTETLETPSPKTQSPKP